jgi:Na+-transporting methylmalonyl-CoA/oxaloacetate decarboxylase beta subunit
MKKDIINFTFGFVCGVVLIYIMVQTTIEQMNMVIDKAYKLTVEMETRIQQDKVDKGEDLLTKPKRDKRII